MINFWNILKAPVTYYRIKKEFDKYWKIIVEEFIEDDNIIVWLDENDFELQENKLRKLDIVNCYEFLMGKPHDEIKEIVFRDYAEALEKLFLNSNMNFEEILKLWVTVGIDKFEDESGIETLKAYFEVNLSYKKHDDYLRALKSFKQSLYFYIPLFTILIALITYVSIF